MVWLMKGFFFSLSAGSQVQEPRAVGLGRRPCPTEHGALTRAALHSP